jgi:tripartite ATP-independent transporter DctM subunit
LTAWNSGEAGIEVLAILTITFALLSILSMPVAISLGIAAIAAMSLASPFPVIGMVQRMVTGVDSFVLLSIPLFMLAGRLMNEGGITDRIFEFARSLVGHIRGGLGHANVVASMIFAGMSGSAVADAGGLGQIEISAMEKQGYDTEFSAAITVASSTIGPIIPPSIPMVIYGAMAEVSVGRLFIGGFIPGVLMGISLMVAVYIYSIVRDYPRDAKFSLRRVWTSFKAGFLPLVTPTIIIGGILAGIFTPTEAAAVAVAYAFILGFFVYRTITIKDIPSILIDTLASTAVVTFVISTSSSFSWLLIIGKIGQLVANFCLSITQSKFVILFLLNLSMFLLGCVIEAGVALILLIPVFLPLVTSVGIDPVHFGVIMVFNLMIGVATPPVGMSLFVVSEVAGVKLERLMRAILPFIVPLIMVLFLITYIPSLVTFLPNLVMGK